MSDNTNEIILEVKDLKKSFGDHVVLESINTTVRKGEVIAIIGPSGCGKSTFLRSLNLLETPTEGHVLFHEQDLTDKSVNVDELREKIGMVFQHFNLFANMTVLENLELGAYLRKDKDGIAKDMDDVFKKFPRLLERKDQLSGTLSGGEQQMLAMGRALMSRPKLLLLDEPSMGLAPLLVKEIFNIIKEINESGTTVLLVEQNANMALSIADKAYVLETGRITLSGTAKELASSEAVRKAYLGG